MNDDRGALIGLGILAIIWIAPIPVGMWIFRRKGYSHHWAWFGILPFVGLVVLLVACLLAPRLKPAGTQGGESAERVAAAWAQYRKGMKELGNGLILLAILQAIAAVLLLVAGAERVLVSIVGIMAVINAISGVFARLLHGWVNYVVALLGGVLIALNFLNLSAIGGNPDHAPPGSQLGGCFGFVIAAAFFYYSIKNLHSLSIAKSSGSS